MGQQQDWIYVEISTGVTSKPHTGQHMTMGGSFVKNGATKVFVLR